MPAYHDRMQSVPAPCEERRPELVRVMDDQNVTVSQIEEVLTELERRLDPVLTNPVPSNAIDSVAGPQQAKHWTRIESETQRLIAIRMRINSLIDRLEV